MKSLLFGGFIAISFLRLSYAEPLCKDDLDCFIKYATSKDIDYLEYGCENYKYRSYGHSCMALYNTLLNEIKKDIVYFCEKGSSLACYTKIAYNLDGKFRDKQSIAKELTTILKQSERRCENEEDGIECAAAYQMHKHLGNSRKANYYYDKAIIFFMKKITTD